MIPWLAAGLAPLLLVALPAGAQERPLDFRDAGIDLVVPGAMGGDCLVCVPPREFMVPPPDRWIIQPEDGRRSLSCPESVSFGPAIDTHLDDSDLALFNTSDVPMQLQFANGLQPIVIDLAPRQIGVFDLKGTRSITIQATDQAGPSQRITAGHFYLVAKQQGRWVFREP